MAHAYASLSMYLSIHVGINVCFLISISLSTSQPVNRLIVFFCSYLCRYLLHLLVLAFQFPIFCLYLYVYFNFYLSILLDSFVGMARVCLTQDQQHCATPVPPHSDHSYAPRTCCGGVEFLGQNTGTAKIKTDNCGTMMKTGIPAISSTELVATTRWTKLLWFSQATYSNSSAAEPPSSTATKSQEIKEFFTQTRTILLLQNRCCVTDAWRTSEAWAR